MSAVIGGGEGAALVRVVREPARHEQRAEVRVAEAELAVGLRVRLDLGRRVARVADEDLLREEDRVDGVLEGLDVEVAVLAAELHQVDGREVAGAVVDGHVLRARVGRVDPARVRERVPGVDGRVVLDARVGAAPGGLGRLPEQVARGDRLDDAAVGARGQVPVLVRLGRLHEGVRHAHGVVRVLVLDRGPVGRVERHVVAGRLEDARLLLLVRLAPDELLDVGVVDVEDDHLGRAPRLAARLDRAGGGVGAAHEADRAGGVAALGELLLARSAACERLTPEPEPPRKMIALAPDPVEDRVHRVVDREDEARRALRLLLEADVEPDRRVEGGELVDEDRLQLGLERLGLVLVGEVAALAAPRADRGDDAADHLLDARLALGRGHAAAEVLLGDDVRRRLRPEARELDALLLEDGPLLAGDERVAQLPLDLVERVAPGDREIALDGAGPRSIGDAVRERLILDDGCVSGARWGRHFSLQGYRSDVGLKLAAGWAGTSEGRVVVGRNHRGVRGTPERGIGAS